MYLSEEYDLQFKYSVTHIRLSLVQSLFLIIKISEVLGAGEIMLNCIDMDGQCAG